MQLPIDINWNENPLAIRCPYNECGMCYYVGSEIQAYGECPSCGTKIANATGVWPANRWFSAAGDIAFLFDNKKIELATVAAASYFEGCLHSFLWKGMFHVWETTRWKVQEGRNLAEDVAANRECQARITRKLDKLAGWRSRAYKLCPRIFGANFDELVAKHVPDGQAFTTNRDNIHEWRNRLLHAGHPMTETWADAVKDRALRATVEFILQCWEVFRPLQHDLIAKVVTERKKKEEC